ncbi:MAG: MinD/ParA family protein [Planctomycetes bacterium]|nr:MinD/ParA family protein [Planctomycetota bacterium]
MDQADRLRNMMGSTGRRTRVIAVASGKGGVGKTNIALNLAICLVRLGQKVIVVDVDIGLANADILLGSQPKIHLGHVLAGEASVLDALAPAPGGVFLLPGSTGMPLVSDLDDEERHFLVSSFQELEEYADILIVDTGAGITRNVIHFATAADEVLVITTPEPTAVTDGYALIKTISREKGFGRIRLVVNQVSGRLEGGRVSERIRMVSRRFLDLEVEDLGHVLADERVKMAVRRKRPFVLEYPQCPASGCLRVLAERLLADGGAQPKSFGQRLAAMGLSSDKSVPGGGG